jgi:hypothetical protein
MKPSDILSYADTMPEGEKTDASDMMALNWMLEHQWHTVAWSAREDQLRLKIKILFLDCSIQWKKSLVRAPPILPQICIHLTA